MTGVTAGVRSSWRAWPLGVRYVLSGLRGRENSPPVSGTNRSIHDSAIRRTRHQYRRSGRIDRNYPQMTQMFTDEEKKSVFICGSIFRIRISAESLAGTMIKAQLSVPVPLRKAWPQR